MKHWKELYEERKMSAEEAATHIKDGDRIVVAHGIGAPLPVLQAIADHKDAYKNVSLHHMMTVGSTPYAGAGMPGHLNLNACFISSGYRGLLEEGLIDLSPLHFSEFPEWLEHEVDSNVVVVVTSPPDEHGFVCCGLNCDYTIPAARRARTIIAEVNPNCPTVYGDTFIHVSDIECFVETDRPMSETLSKETTEIEQKIGGYCAELIRDGATLQLGVGGIPDAVLPFLMKKKDLGIHSEVIGDGVQVLMEAGVITGKEKTINKGLVVSASLFGSHAFHRFANRNPAIELRPVDYTNDPRIIAQHKNMVSINATVQVDLTGQVNSEYMGGKQFSGMGGQVDFVRGAKMAEGGISIIACSSTAKGGKISKIVPVLDAGAPVTTARTDVDFIVTEYGIAQLGGKSLLERAKALIQVAHPDFRDGLREEAERRYKRRL
ncbi:MAG: acetyl-CoA hydrolase/transferase family protein [Lachnospiraceae bacterium]|nr:acetyl-CoA hydrolase/transferase family protein [Lachnospiraceae bacterium]